MDLKILQNRLRTIRTAYQLPINEAPWICKVSKSTISNWETGLRLPTIDGLYDITVAYGISVDWLCDLSPTPYTETTVARAEDAFPVTTEMLLDAIAGAPVNGLPDIGRYNDIAHRYPDDDFRTRLPLKLRADITVLAHVIDEITVRTEPPASRAVMKRFALTESQARRMAIYRTALYDALVKQETFFDL